MRVKTDALADGVASYVVLAEAYYMINTGCENWTDHVVLRPVLHYRSRTSTGCSQETHRLFQIILKTVHNFLFCSILVRRNEAVMGGVRVKVLRPLSQPAAAATGIGGRPILNRPLIRESPP